MRAVLPSISSPCARSPRIPAASYAPALPLRPSVPQFLPTTEYPHTRPPTCAPDSIRQQSPSLGKPPTGATSAHHLVTPTNNFFAPIAHNIEVALGASEPRHNS